MKRPRHQNCVRANFPRRLTAARPSALHVKVKMMQPLTPPLPLVSPEAVVGMAVYTAKAMLRGKGRDVWEMVVDYIP
jgi:pyruvate dehydrogenase (quinone)